MMAVREERLGRLIEFSHWTRSFFFFFSFGMSPPLHLLLFSLPGKTFSADCWLQFIINQEANASPVIMALSSKTEMIVGQIHLNPGEQPAPSLPTDLLTNWPLQL